MIESSGTWQKLLAFLVKSLERTISAKKIAYCRRNKMDR